MVEPGKARDGVYGCGVDEHGKESAACPQLRLDLLAPLEPVVWLEPD